VPGVRGQYGSLSHGTSGGVARFGPLGPLRGTVQPPPDKSVSHRAALIAAMGEGETTIEGYLDAADTRSTLAAVEALGRSGALEEYVYYHSTLGELYRRLNRPDDAAAALRRPLWQ